MSYEAWGEPPPEYCEMCGSNADNCECDQCPVCDSIGNPECYKSHGMIETEEQIQGRIRNDPDDFIYDPAEW